MVKTFVKTLIHNVIRHNIGYLAAVISYFGFSSMIPLVLLLIFGASLFVAGTAVEHLLDDLLQTYVPRIPTGQSFITTTIGRLTTLRPAISIIGIVGVVWTSVGGFVSLQTTLDTISDIHHRRSFILQYVFGFLMLGVLLALTLISTVAAAISPTLVAHISHTHTLMWLTLAHDIARLSFLLIMFSTCFFCYRFLPSRPASNVALLIGAAIATASIYASRSLFAIYTHHLGNYEMIYGTLTFVMLFSFWIYISSVIFLFGLEVTVAIEQTKANLKQKKEPLPKT